MTARVRDGSFGYRFPEHCSDPGNEHAPCGCEEQAFERVMIAEVPWLEWPLSPDVVPDTPVIMDMLEFCAGAVGLPIPIHYHSYMRHQHLRWDREEGLAKFVSDINLILARNGVALQLSPQGQAQRLLPEPVAQALGWTLFTSEDGETNRLLETARHRIISPKPDERQDALEKLWDAFERIKTLEPGANKKVQADALLDRVAQAGSPFRTTLGEEAAALTAIGNQFQIRHWETNRTPLAGTDQVDYLFVRMFAFIRLVLKSTGRGG